MNQIACPAVARLFLLFFLCTIASLAKAEPIDLTTSGEARVRWEYKNNQDFSKTANDRNDFIGSRFRLNLDLKASEKTSIFFQPQLSRTWGQKVFVESGTATVGGDTVPVGSEKNASGGLTDPHLGTHQAYIKTLLNEDLTLTLGRQEIVYGDHLVVGNVGWSNVGRSFDAIKLRQSFGKSWVDAFWSEIVETSSQQNERSFSGLYTHIEGLSFLSILELYSFYDKDHSKQQVDRFTYGSRIKWTGEQFGITVEPTAQSEDGFQVDGTISYSPLTKFKVDIGYFYANQHYDQLFPTAHKWLGFADFFSRRNTQGARINSSYRFSDQLLGTLNFHHFNRASDKDPVYSFAGTTIGSGANTSSHIADEIDITLTLHTSKNLTYQLGASAVLPGNYIKQSLSSDDMGEFLYFSVETKL